MSKSLLSKSLRGLIVLIFSKLSSFNTKNSPLSHYHNIVARGYIIVMASRSTLKSMFTVILHHPYHPSDNAHQAGGAVAFTTIEFHGPLQSRRPLHITAFAPGHRNVLPPMPPLQCALTLNPCLDPQALWSPWLIVQALFLQQYIKAAESLKAVYPPVDLIMIGRKLYSTQFPSHSDVPHLSSRKTAGPPGQDQWARAPYTYYQSMMANSPAPAGYRHLSHKTALCKHFTRTKGYCPMGEMCNFIHDLSLCGIPDERSHSTPGSSGSVPGTGSSQKKTTHCWAFVHGLCKLVDCPYVHPADTAPYLKHTPCLAWPACFHGADCRFKHPEPLPSPPPVVHTGYLPGARNVRSLEHHGDIRFPHSGLSYGGTAYCHQPLQQSPAPASSVSPLPAQPSYNVAPPAEPFLSFELRYERALNATSPVSPRAIVAPMSLDQALASETAPPLASTRKSAVQKRKTLPPSLRIITAVPAKKEAAQEFPHTPTVTSTAMTRKGHARRISVSVKTELETFANASPNTPVAYVKRQSWAAFSTGDRHSNGFPC